VFQLYPNGWRFAPGHAVKLELAGQDAPYSRPDNTPGMIAWTDLSLRLSTVDQPNCTTILHPARPFVPAGEQLAPGVDANPTDHCKSSTDRRTGTTHLPHPKRRSRGRLQSGGMS
jgi:hypothetical protein